LIAGQVDGPRPVFAATSADMPRKDHIDIWIAPPTPPAFPPIGYGEQSQEIPTIASCGDDRCRAWFRSTVIHRGLMARTLVRQYSMSPNAVSEVYAKPAYDQMLAPIDKNYQDYVQALAPTGTAHFQALAGAASGYSFEAVLPWDSFPPFASLELSKLRLKVDVFSAHTGDPASQPFSSTDAALKPGAPSPTDTVALESGRHFRITACGYPLISLNKERESGRAIFFPRREDDITRVLRIRNFDPIYSYHLAPIAEVTNFVEKPAGADTVVCGPRLAMVRNGKVTRYPMIVDPSTLDVKLQPGGGFLMLSGPAWKRADKSDEDGCCEGLPMIHYDVWFVSPAGKIREIFEDHVVMSGIAEGIVDFGAEASPDAKKITTFVQWFNHDKQTATWTSTTFCRQGMQYIKCGSRLHSDGPKEKKW
jgi:hypothetical protein